MTYYTSYWGSDRQLLHDLPKDGDDARNIREHVYARIRKDTGLNFTEFGGDVERRLRWIEENDTDDPCEIERRMDAAWGRMNEEDRAAEKRTML